jgi:short/branched chain acyl-CoA dehydrogenase
VLQHGQWLINGSKIFITNASSPVAGVTTLQVVTGSRGDGKKELSCLLVPAGTPGYTAKTMHGKMMWRSSDTAELFFEDCKVPEENVLGKRGDGFKQMMQTLDGGRLSIAAMGLGGAQGAYELALNYAQQRKQFGMLIGKFQANAFKLASMAMEIEAARNMLYKACWLREQHRSFGHVAAMSKLYCSEVFERFFRDQKLLEIGEGTSEVQRIVISRNLGL